MRRLGGRLGSVGKCVMLLYTSLRMNSIWWAHVLSPGGNCIEMGRKTNGEQFIVNKNWRTVSWGSHKIITLIGFNHIFVNVYVILDIFEKTCFM